MTGCDVKLRSQAANDPAGGPRAGGAECVAVVVDGGPSCWEMPAAAGTD